MKPFKSQSRRLYTWQEIQHEQDALLRERYIRNNGSEALPAVMHQPATNHTNATMVSLTVKRLSN